MVDFFRLIQIDIFSLYINRKNAENVIEAGGRHPSLVTARLLQAAGHVKYGDSVRGISVKRVKG